MRFNAESSMPRKNSVVEWAGKPQRHFDAKARKKNAPRNGGGPEGTPPERLRYGAATKNQRVRMGFRREDIWGVGNSYKEACVLGAAGYGRKGGCGIFNTNQNFLNRFLFGNGDFDVNVWNRGVYTSK